MGRELRSSPTATASDPKWRSPFAIFGLVAVLAAAGAIAEALYYATSPGLSAASLGTTLGIIVAVGAFLAVGLWAPPND
jgi:tryptophan-rich sensory protein